MKSQLGPVWTPEQVEAGRKYREAVEAHFDSSERSITPILEADQQAVEEVRSRHEAALMRKANVVAVALGVRSKRGKLTGQSCLVVYVTKKLPKSALDEADLIPATIEGVPVDVVESGEVKALGL